MKVISLAILFSFLLLNVQGAVEEPIKNSIGIRPILKIKKSPLRWLKTEIFMGMHVYGDTLIISTSVDPEIDKSDKEAGEEYMIRQKFKESRMVRVLKFGDKRRFKVDPFEGDINKNKHNGGLALLSGGKSGLIPVFNTTRTKSQMYYVEINDDKVEIKEPWEGNVIGDYVSFPTFSNKFRETVFMTKDGDYDLYLWDNEKKRVSAFRHNSDADEMFPSIHNDSILIFSSDRLKKGDYDLFYYNMNTDSVPSLLFPDALQSSRSELGIAFSNDSTFYIASRKGKGAVNYERIDLKLEPVKKKEYVELAMLDLGPISRETKQLREQGRIALTMFQERYNVSIPVRRHENIFKDSADVDREIVKAVRKVLERDNVVDVSFLLPVEITDTAYLLEGYNPDVYVTEGLRKIAELSKVLTGSSIMALGFANAPGGSDLNLMRSYYQASSYQMQFTDFSGIDSSKVHIIASGDYVENKVSIRRISEKEKRGAIYLFKNIRAPQKVVAYKLNPGETKELVAGRLGLSSFEFTYYNVLLTPFITPPDNVMYFPVKELEMVWQGHDLRETAKQFNTPIKQLLKINNLSDYINDSKRVLYIP